MSNESSITAELESKLEDLKKQTWSFLEFTKKFTLSLCFLKYFRTTYNTKSDEWIKEKLDVQHRMKDLEESIRCSAGEGWDSERERFKHIIDDRDNQITQLKIECDVARSQVSTISGALWSN